MGLFPLKALDRFWVIKFSTLHNPALWRMKKKKAGNVSNWQIMQLVEYANQTSNIDVTLYFACLPPANISAGSFWSYNKTCVWLSLPFCTKQMFYIQQGHLLNIWRKKCDANRPEIKQQPWIIKAYFLLIFHMKKKKALSLKPIHLAMRWIVAFDPKQKVIWKSEKRQINIFSERLIP